METTARDSSATPLGHARKSFTRSRICEAAKAIFIERGFSSATLDEIARASGAQRSTVYNHFKNKEDILAAIAEEYLAGLVELAAELPGPLPSKAEFNVWLQRVVSYTLEEQAPIDLLIALGDQNQVPETLLQMGRELVEAFAINLPAFQRALKPGPEQGISLARANIVLYQLARACLHQSRSDNQPQAHYTLVAAGELFANFICGDATHTDLYCGGLSLSLS